MRRWIKVLVGSWDSLIKSSRESMISLVIVGLDSRVSKVVLAWSRLAKRAEEKSRQKTWREVFFCF